MHNSGSSFSITIYANQTTDPQGLELSFIWEVINTPNPDGSIVGSFVSQNNNHSITSFSHSGFVVYPGVYTIRLTVINTVGVSASRDLIINVN